MRHRTAWRQEEDRSARDRLSPCRRKERNVPTVELRRLGYSSDFRPVVGDLLANFVQVVIGISTVQRLGGEFIHTLQHVMDFVQLSLHRLDAGYKMKLEALKHQGKRHDLTSAPGVQKLTARDLIAQDAGEKSGMMVARYISLTKLVSPLLVMVDEEKLSVSTAADYISDLPESYQTDLLTVMDKLGVVPSKSQLARIKQYSRDGTLTAAVMDAVLSEARPVPVQVTLKKDRLRHYFPASYSSQQMEEVIFSLLESWKVQNTDIG